MREHRRTWLSNAEMAAAAIACAIAEQTDDIQNKRDDMMQILPVYVSGDTRKAPEIIPISGSSSICFDMSVYHRPALAELRRFTATP